MTSRDTELIPSIERFSNARVVCVGDVMLDNFVYGDVNRISPEAPIPVVRVNDERAMLGGAGNVARNLSSLGARVTLVTVLGDDTAAESVGKTLAELPNSKLRVVTDKSRRTSVKTRFISGSQQLLRVDNESTHGIDADILSGLLIQFSEALADCDVVVLSDYAKGVLTAECTARLVAAAKDKGKLVMVDPKGRDFGRYRGATMLKPNLLELAEATSLPVGSAAEVEAAARGLIETCHVDAVMVTRGARGMMLVRKGRTAFSLPSVAREVFDVSGAGDTVAAAFAAGVAIGMEMEDAMRVANIAAGIVVGKVGTAAVTQEQLLSELEAGKARAAESRVVALDEAVHRVRLWRRLGLRIGLTKRAFSSVDAAAVAFLEDAKERCDRLIVVLPNGSETKPIVLAAMVCVDLVVVNGTGVIENEIQPDVTC